MRPVNSSIRMISPFFDDVVLVALEQLVGAQRLVGVVDQRDVGGLVERALQQAAPRPSALRSSRCRPRCRTTERCFSSCLKCSASSCGMIASIELVEVAAVFGRAGDDQRRARFIDQDRVDFVDDGEAVAALDHVAQRVLHVVAQIVEAELVVRAVGDVAGVGLRGARCRRGRARSCRPRGRGSGRSGPSIRCRAWRDSR